MSLSSLLEHSGDGGAAGESLGASDTVASASYHAARARLRAAGRFVVKIGTNVLVRPDGAVALGTLYRFIEAIASLRASGRDIVVVSSGAIGLGSARLADTRRGSPDALARARAAIGQSQLMAMYDHGLLRMGAGAAQLLVTSNDMATLERRGAFRDTVELLLRSGAIPIVNENDVMPSTSPRSETVTANERDSRSFRDNDMLSVLVAEAVQAEALIILSDVDGLFTDNPTEYPEARLIPLVHAVTPAMIAAAGGGNPRGRGGMASKLAAVDMAMAAGLVTVVANGTRIDLHDLLSNPRNTDRATIFLPSDSTECVA